jgi:uncharacterized membrane-anchored protein
MPDRQSTTVMLNKVPEVTVYFWVIKVLATTVGETAADFLSTTLNLGLTGTSFVMGALFALALTIQVVRKSYVPWIYWLTVVLISVVGTLITDNLVDNFGISLEATTIAFGITLAIVFAVWYAVESTLSIHTIVTTRRELFYWAAVLFTFALGTAGGDLTSEGLGLGYEQAALGFAALIAAVAGLHFFLKLDAVLAFWIAYILTRPLGASIGDLLSQAPSDGGWGLGTLTTTAVFLGTILGLVIYLTFSRRDQLAQESAGT